MCGESARTLHFHEFQLKLEEFEHLALILYHTSPFAPQEYIRRAPLGLR